MLLNSVYLMTVLCLQISAALSPPKCQWPSVNSFTQLGYNAQITYCKDSTMKREHKCLPESEIFHNVSGDRCLSFNNLFNLPKEQFKLAKYPEIYEMYPSSVPLKEMVTKIALGRPVSYVR